jgi:hypothetical protein
LYPFVTLIERRANHCGISVRTVTSEGRAVTDMKEALCTSQKRRGFENLKEMLPLMIS